MDSFEFNKIAGAVLGTLLFVMGTGFAADVIFSPQKPEKPGYEIVVAQATPAGGAAGAPAAAAVEPIAVRLAKADVAKGANAAKKCVSCHAFEKGGANKVGPAMWNIVERTKGGAAGFPYSNALKERVAKGEKWDYASLDAFLENPKGYLPGTTMGFAGIKKADERADVIAYLRSLADSPAPLPKP